MNDGTIIDGVPLRVVELTGDPGDVILMHSDTFHAAAPNRLTEPRMMLTEMVSPNRSQQYPPRTPTHRVRTNDQADRDGILTSASGDVGASGSLTRAGRSVRRSADGVLGCRDQQPGDLVDR